MPRPKLYQIQQFWGWHRYPEFAVCIPVHISLFVIHLLLVHHFRTCLLFLYPVFPRIFTFALNDTVLLAPSPQPPTSQGLILPGNFPGRKGDQLLASTDTLVPSLIIAQPRNARPSQHIQIRLQLLLSLQFLNLTSDSTIKFYPLPSSWYGCSKIVTRWPPITGIPITQWSPNQFNSLLGPLQPWSSRIPY